MITVKSKKITLQAEGTYDEFKVSGNIIVASDSVETASGGIYAKGDNGSETQIGNFNVNSSGSVSVYDKKHLSEMGIISEAVNSFMSDVNKYIAEGGVA